MNGNDERKAAVIRLVIWSLVLLILVVTFALFWRPVRKGAIFGWDLSSYTYADAESYHVGNGECRDSYRTLDLSWISGSVTVQPYEGSVTKIEETVPSGTDDSKRLRWKCENGRLTVKFCAPLGLFDFTQGNLNKQLTVYVPAEILTSLEQYVASTVSAEMTVIGMSAGEANLDNVSGRMNLGMDVSGKIHIDTVSGAVTLEGSADEVELDTVSGDVSLQGNFRKTDVDSTSGRVEVKPGNAARELKADTVSGRVRIVLPSDIAGFCANFDTVSGDFSGNFAVNISQGRYLYGDESLSVKVDTVSGDLEIVRMEPEA